MGSLEPRPDLGNLPLAEITTTVSIYFLYITKTTKIKASFNNTSIDGMMHIGHKPSLNTSKHSIEAHLFNFNQDIYNETLCIQCIDYVRPNKRFENLDALKAQLAEDKISCVNILSN